MWVANLCLVHCGFLSKNEMLFWKPLLCKQFSGFVSAYHGTSAFDAKSIVEQNIRIEYGRRRQDFSDLSGGFYAGSSLRSAVKFAKKRLDRLESPGIKTLYELAKMSRHPKSEQVGYHSNIAEFRLSGLFDHLLLVNLPANDSYSFDHLNSYWVVLFPEALSK